MTRLRIVTFALVATLAVGCFAAPVPEPDPNQPEIIEIIAPAGIAQETLDSLNLGEPNAEQSERNKRTIGILRQLFPSLSQIIDQKIQQIISVLLRTVGRNLLAGALGGGGGNGGGTTSTDGGKISVSLPAFGPDDDDEDSDEDTSSDADKKPANLASRFSGDAADETTVSSVSDNEVLASNPDVTSEDTVLSQSSESPSTDVSIISTSSDIPDVITTSIDPNSDTTTIPVDAQSKSSESPSTDISITPSSSSTSVVPDINTTSINSDSDSTTIPATSAVNGDNENLLSGAESQQSEVRVQFADPDSENKTDNEQSADQESAASGGNDGAIDDLSLDDADSSDENRNKRFLSFGIGGGDGGSSGGSGGGSGNFLFDIIRRPAESVARAAGQAFRILTGTDSIGLGISATHTAVRDLPTTNNSTKLVAGSGGTEASDEATAHPDGDVAKGDGYTEGIPGPVTRLFIIANRGISNLIQDLILRIAQTSERIVNFKARLITSII